jgi:hypothetical protein
MHTVDFLHESEKAPQMNSDGTQTKPTQAGFVLILHRTHLKSIALSPC